MCAWLCSCQICWFVALYCQISFQRLPISHSYFFLSLSSSFLTSLHCGIAAVGVPLLAPLASVSPTIMVVLLRAWTSKMESVYVMQKQVEETCEYGVSSLGNFKFVRVLLLFLFFFDEMIWNNHLIFLVNSYLLLLLLILWFLLNLVIICICIFLFIFKCYLAIISVYFKKLPNRRNNHLIFYLILSFCYWYSFCISVYLILSFCYYFI